jgi:cobalt/nickel transport protein
MTSFQKRLLTGLLIMALLSPLGIVLPKFFNSGDAWGEWSTAKIEKLIGYVPEGMKKLAGIWKAPVSGYNPGGENASMAAQLLYYIISGCIGIIAAGGVIYLISRLLLKNGK